MECPTIASNCSPREKTLNALFRDQGIWMTDPPAIAGELVFEKPIYLFEPKRVKNVAIGAFSYINYGVSAFDTEVGRYCSIAESAMLGPYEHPTDWLSTHPFQFSGIREHVPFYAFPEYTSIASENSRVEQFNQRTTLIGNDVWIGSGAFVRRGVRIGDGAIIAARAVVLSDVAPYTIVAGVPARPIRTRLIDTIIERPTASRWWLYDLGVMKGRVDYSNIQQAMTEIERAIADESLPLYEPGWVKTERDANGEWTFDRCRQNTQERPCR